MTVFSKFSLYNQMKMLYDLENNLTIKKTKLIPGHVKKWTKQLLFTLFNKPNLKSYDDYYKDTAHCIYNPAYCIIT